MCETFVQNPINIPRFTASHVKVTHTHTWQILQEIHKKTDARGIEMHYSGQGLIVVFIYNVLVQDNLTS